MKDLPPAPTPPGWKLNTKLLPFLVGLLGLLYALTGYRGWLVFLIGCAGAWLLAFVWTLALQRGLRLERGIHYAWARVGDTLPEELSVTNSSRLPAVWVEVVDESETPADPLRLVTDVEGRASRRRHLLHLFKRRGFYQLGPTRLRTGDPFGIYTLTLSDRHSTSILVTPPQLALTRLRIAPGGWAGDRQRRRQFMEREISDAGTREYLPGDSLRRIHWPASAHTDTLIVRQSEASATRDWWIFVDLEAATQAGSGQDSTLELSIVLAASLATRALREHRRVGLCMAGPGLVWLAPRSGPDQRWQILKALAVAGAGDRSLAQLLAFGHSGRAASRIVITPTTDPGWVAAARQDGFGEKLTVLLVDPLEFGGTTGQERLSRAVAYAGIASTRMPRSLLEAAYASLRPDARRRPAPLEPSQRYLAEGRSPWQSLD